MSANALTGRAAVAAALTAAIAAAFGAVLVHQTDWDGLVAAIAAAAIAGVFGGLVALAAGRPVARQLAAIKLAADRFASGARHARVDESPPVTTALTASFNNMVARTEALLAEVERDRARTSALLDASVDAMVAVGRDTSVQMVNPAAASLFDVGIDSALGRALIEVARDYELDLLVRGVIAEGQRRELPVIAFGPRRVPLRATAVPIAGGGEWTVLLVLTDLTEVQRFDAMRRDFLSNVSHEIRTPLASMRAIVEIIGDGDVDDDPNQRQIFLGHIERQIERLSSLVNELLDLGRIESGAMRLQPEPIDVPALVRETVTLLEQQATERSVNIEMPDGPGPVVEADRQALSRVLTNLLDNAIKYSPAGGTVSVSAEAHGGVVSIAVKDDGPGIAPESLHRVFERFYKEDAARASSGAGLGLAIVKHIARIHGGSAEVVSAPGQGAIFSVHLPEHFIGSRAVSA